MHYETILRLLADGAVVPVVVIGGYALLKWIPKDRRFDAYARILMAGLTAYLLATILSVIYQPSLHRPFEILGVQAGAAFLNNAGFPSDHALFVTAITCAVWFETRRKYISLILVALTVVICIARVFALVHTPVDVIFGVIIALVGALWYLNDPIKLPIAVRSLQNK